MSDERPTFGSLFAGIGGIDLGLERAGWQCRFQVEWDPFCQRVLAKHWPDVPRYGDISAVDWSGVERVDLLAGGFPCQPVSVAGKRRGQDDERWLWPEFARAIRDLRPLLVLVENVPGLLARGMGDVLGDLAALGYDAEWRVISAAASGAPHLRERVWIVAHDDRRYRGASRQGEAQAGTAGHALNGGLSDAERRGPAVADAPRDGWQSWWSHHAPQEPRGREPDRSGLGSDGLAHSTSERPPRSGQPLEPVDPAKDRTGQADQLGNGGWWATEPDVGRVAHGVPARVDRLRSLGNAVVPQVVEVIGRRLLASLERAA